MKKLLFVFVLTSLFIADLSAQVEYKVITVVESIVPAGIGRSRIIEAKNDQDITTATGQRQDGVDGAVKEVRRKDLKIDEFKETKLLNFYSLGGINFQNIASNDAMIEAKLSELSAEGWELAFVNSGVESAAGNGDGNGIFITRFVFKRNN
jgi:hypothetical protein